MFLSLFLNFLQHSLLPHAQFFLLPWISTYFFGHGNEKIYIEARTINTIKNENL